MVDRTGIMGGVSFAVSRPEVSAAISTPQVNRGHHVPLLAGADTYSSITHIDSRVPESFSDGQGGTYSPDPHLHVHETVEKWVMEHGAEHADELGLTPDDFVDTPSGPRVKYEVAHDRFALPAEKASVEAAGIPWKLYNAHMAGSYAGIKGKKAGASPASLYTAPYEDSGATGLLSPSKDANMDYFGGLLGNGIDPAGTAGLMGIPQMHRSGHVAGRPYWQSLYGQPSNQGPEMVGGPSPYGSSPDDSGGSDLSIADPGVTPAGGPPMSPPTPSPAGGLFGPQNADLISSLGGALLGAPTVREGLGAFGQQAPQIMAGMRRRNATIDYLSANPDSPMAKAIASNPKFKDLLYANPEMADSLVKMQFMPHPTVTVAPGARVMDEVTHQFIDGGGNGRGDGTPYDLEQADKLYKSIYGDGANLEVGAPQFMPWYKKVYPTLGQGSSDETGQLPARGKSEAAMRRGLMAANAIVKNYIGLPIYNLVANGSPYIARIDVAARSSGSAADVDLVDSAIKLATGGGQITEAQVSALLKGSSAWDQLDAASKYVKNGGFLSDNQKQQIKNLSHQIYSEYQKQYQPIYNKAMSEMEKAGVPEDFRGVMPDLNELSRDAGVAGGNGEYPRPGDNGLPPSPSEAPPIAGALRAPDGSWVIQQNGKWFRVEAQ